MSSTKEKLFLFSYSHITLIHQYVLEEKNLDGVNQEKLEGIIGRIESRIYYESIKDPFEIASWYGFAIARGHGFVDGNKRTATIAAISYLMLNNIDLEFEQHELADNIEKVAKGELDRKYLCEWIKSNTSCKSK